MEFKSIFDIVFHIGDYLQTFAKDQSLFCYILMAAIIFFETGFVVTPFLPGDSLLFTVGALAATGAMQLWIISLFLKVVRPAFFYSYCV